MKSKTYNTKKALIKKKKPKKKIESANDYVRIIQDKFNSLKEIKRKIVTLKGLYAQYTNIVEELLPLFIEVNVERITIKREITIGDRKYKYTPSLYNSNENKITSKSWKSTAFETGNIEV
jgi:hypothetical protein